MLWSQAGRKIKNDQNFFLSLSFLLIVCVFFVFFSQRQPLKVIPPELGKRSFECAVLFSIMQVFYLWIGKCCNDMFIRDVLGCPNYASIPPNMVSKTHIVRKLQVSLKVGFLIIWKIDESQVRRSFSPMSNSDSDEGNGGVALHVTHTNAQLLDEWCNAALHAFLLKISHTFVSQ